MEKVNLYAIHDFDKDLQKAHGAKHVTREEAAALNKDGWGIYRSVNSFEGDRKALSLTSIDYWYVDIDGDKEAIRRKVANSPAIPSKVIETKRGYHLWFKAIDATLQNYRSIETGLCHYFDGDYRARDISRLLREPGFYHMKDPDSPYLIKQVQMAKVAYKEALMRYLFKPPLPPKEAPKLQDKITFEGDDLTSFLNSLNHADALTQISGKSYVNGEIYSFRNQSRGRLNILVNGRSTSCFIDEAGKIGAIPGGPTLWQWLKYYGHDNKRIYTIIKDEFQWKK